MKCKEKCSRKRSCGHLCDRLCSEDCNLRECNVCRKLRVEKQKKEDAERRKQALLEVEEELKKLKEAAIDDEPTRRELRPVDDDAVEYYTVCELTEKSVQSGNTWRPLVTKIEKVNNHKLTKRWLEAKSKMTSPQSEAPLKFHCADHESIESILKNGFRLPEKPGRFDKGVYFTTDPSKNAQRQLDACGSNELLVCKVLLGRSKIVQVADDKLSYRKAIPRAV